MPEHMDTIVPALLGIVGIIAGVIIGFILNYINDCRKNKLKLAFDLQPDQEISEIEIEKQSGIKTGPSGMCLYCYNIGSVPFLPSSISLCYNPRDTFDIKLSDLPVAALMPFHSATYPLDNQDYDGIVFHTKNNKAEKCKILAIGVDEKKCKSSLNLTWVPHAWSKYDDAETTSNRP